MEHAAYQAAISAFSKFLADGGGWSVDCATACLCRADCYQQLQQPEDALQSVFQSFQYATPREDACYRIGEYLSAHQQLEESKPYLKQKELQKKKKGGTLYGML